VFNELKRMLEEELTAIERKYTNKVHISEIVHVLEHITDHHIPNPLNISSFLRFPERKTLMRVQSALVAVSRI
jgi:DNA integrity scanning protein DisA with diadenylate cyclase activity